LAPIFDEYQLVQNFIISWVNEAEEPTFLEDWQQSLHRGQNQRYRRSTAAPCDARPLNGNGDNDQRSAPPSAPSRHHVTVRGPVNPSEPAKAKPEKARATSLPPEMAAQPLARGLDDSRQPLAGGILRRSAPLPENGHRMPPDSDEPLARIITRRQENLPTRTSALAPSRRRVIVREPVSDSEGSESSFPLSKRKAKVPREGAHSDQSLAAVVTRQPLTRTSALAPSRRRVIVREPASDSEGSKSSFPLSKRKSKAKPLPSEAEMTATDGETLGRKRYNRRQPKANGNIHDPPCGHCQRRHLECLEDEYGGACVPCKKRKTGCTHSGVKGKRLSRKAEVGSETEREVEEPARKKRRRVRKNTYMTDTDAEGLAKVKRRRVEAVATANEDEQEAGKSRPVFMQAIHI
jgi:hypothetical protein